MGAKRRSGAHCVRDVARDGCVSRACEKDQGAITLVLDVAKALERISLPVARAWAMHLNCGRAAPDHHGHPPWIEMELLLRIVLED